MAGEKDGTHSRNWGGGDELTRMAQAFLLSAPSGPGQTSAMLPKEIDYQERSQRQRLLLRVGDADLGLGTPS